MRTKISMLLVFGIVAASACNSKEVEFTSQSLDKVDPKVVVDQEFKAGVIGDGRVVYQPNYGLVQETVFLKEKPPVVTTKKQIERQVKVEEFAQGHDGSLSSEEFAVSSAGKLDLLVVVDNSNSMAEEQVNLASKLAALTKSLKTTDWQMGVITTDSATLRNGGKPIKASDVTADVDFFNAVSVGTGGSSNERGIRQAHAALAGCDSNTHAWLRKDASMAVLFLSDEESSEGIFDTSPADLIARMKSCRPVPQLKAYALTWEPTCPADSGESEGKKYLQVVNAFRGVKGSICQADFTTTLEAISKDVARTVKRDFALQHEPVGSSISLEVDGVPYTDYEVKGKTLTLKNADGNLVKLKVSYRHDPTPRFDRVVIADMPASDTLQVWVDSTRLDASKVSFDKATRSVFFSDMPADGTKIKVKYRKEGSLMKDFDFAAVSPVGEVTDVMINGVAATGWTMDDTTRVLTFQDAPEDGAAVSMTVTLPDSNITHYPMGASQDGARVMDVSAQDQVSGDNIDMLFENGELVFDEADVMDGRAVTVTYDYGDAGTVLTHELSSTPLEGSVTVRAVGPSDCIDSVSVVEKVVTYSCNASELSEVEINYRYVAQRFTTFKIEGGFPSVETQIQVYVDGGAISDWKREGNDIVIAEDELRVDSKVRVVATVYGVRQ